MRILLITDIHANLTALDAVLVHAGEFDAAWCLGDLVGYGPDPNECVDRVRALPGLVCLVGNHDKAALGELNLDAFNIEARSAVEWTINALRPDTRDYLAALPERHMHGDFTLVHGSPRRPVWEYILDGTIAAANFARFDTPYCLVGHTHVPAVFVDVPGSPTAFEGAPPVGRPLPLGDERMILNPGSVGQPRDHDPRAAYALLDLNARTFEHRRLPYDIPAVQARMRDSGLPPRLAARLESGW